MAKYDIKPKPTMYNGRQYRSRLEARWQAMFDTLYIPAQYEPYEINGYNPDFVITCESPHYQTNSIIVEIKPSVFVDNTLINETYEKYKNEPAHILLLDENPFCDTKSADWCVIGIGSQWYGKQNKYKNEERSHMHQLVMKGWWDFSSMTMKYEGMIHKNAGLYYPKYFQSQKCGDTRGLLRFWKEAANKVMFQVKNKDNG